MPKQYTPNPHHWDESRNCYVLTMPNGMECLVDRQDISIALGYRWDAKRDRGTHYAKTSAYLNGDGSRRSVSMHRLIMSPPDNMQVDHINGNGLDNRRSNLRLLTHDENQWNQRGATRTNTSGYIGVTFKKGQPRNKPWTAHISHQNRKIVIGYFATAEEAARARDEKAIELRGDLATLNFPRT